MKLTTLLIITLITLASCETSWFNPGKVPTIPAPQDHSKMDNLRYFFDNLFSTFNLSRPNQILKCFCDKSADRFFQSLYDTHQILIDTNERNSLKLHIELGKLILTSRPLRKIYACISMTQDFTDLLNALDIKERNPTEFMRAKYIYYQANYPELVETFRPVIDGLDNKNHTAAGRAYGNVIKNLVRDVKGKGLNFLAYAGFDNGFAVKLDLNNPTDILECFDNDSAGTFLEFVYRLSKAVSNGTWKDAPANTNLFWREIGRDLMNKIPKETRECMKNSNDHHELTERIKIETESREFLDLMLKYIEENRFHYYMMMKGIKHSFDHFNVNHAGYVYAHFIEQIAKSK